MHPRLLALRLVAITEGDGDGDGSPGDGRDPVLRAAALGRECPAGGLLVQVRAKALEGAALAELTRAIVAALRPRGHLVLVNDRLDVALGAGADGVHLPERGLAIRDALALAAPAGLLVGCSRHDAAAATQAVAAGAHLVHLGPIWATPSKAGLGEPLGVAALRQAAVAIGERAALIAVGGIGDGARAAAARAAGAHAVAAIRAAWGDGKALL